MTNITGSPRIVRSGRRPLLHRLLVLLVAVVVLASACSGSSDDSADNADADRTGETGETGEDDGDDAGDNPTDTGEPTGGADEESSFAQDTDRDEADGGDDDAEAPEPTAEITTDAEDADRSSTDDGSGTPTTGNAADDASDAESGSAAEAAPAAEEPARDQAQDADDADDADDAGDGSDGSDSEGLFVQPDAGGEDGEGGLFDEPSEQPDGSRLIDNRFQFYGYREFVAADRDPLSTFALDVDTGSYTVARRWLTEGVLPPPESVRVEEFVNAFDYDYDTPNRGLEISVDGGPSPFDPDNVLVRVGVQAETIPDGERPPVALTFIVDTSGSMDQDNRLGLVKDSLEILVDELDDDDTVAIVVYSNTSGVVLEPTPLSDSRRIYDAIDSLQPGGSTNLESGLREGYELAARAFRSDGVNRVIIASDGVANAGITDQSQLSDYIRGYADEGIQLVTVGYGMGNFNDTLMEQLADNGDGFYAYVDTEDEAERLFEDELTSTLITAAIDAKIQVEFDPDIVDEYRLIGFENRGVLDSDFRNDRVDAGELGAGHQVTAMYEISLRAGVELDDGGGIGDVFLRWQDPESGQVTEIDEDIDLRDVAEDFDDTAIDFQLATVVTAFADVLRDNPYADDVRLDNIWVEADRVADRIDRNQMDRVDELVDLLAIARDLTESR